MRQVPYYLVIGNGRISRHFQYYLTLLNIPFSLWFRQLPINMLKEKLKHCTHILILISDDAIENFIQENLERNNAIQIHFSGALVTNQAYGAHPLMTFSHDLYSKERYQSINFIIDQDAPDFHTLLPGFTNTHFRLNKNLKEKYHALCVLSGNYSCMLWQKLFSAFEKEFNISSSAAHPFLLQLTQNLIVNYEQALTGPLVRNDTNTIQKNIDALSEDPVRQVYQSFILYYLENKCDQIDECA